MVGPVTVNTRRVHELGSNAINFPRAFHVRWPGYAPTPLLDLPDLASELGIGRLWVKDESRRFQMHSFELLGVAWALYREVLGRLGRRVRWESVDDLVLAIEPVRNLRVVAVTDDELGVAVARAARALQLDAVIYAPDEMPPAWFDAVAGEGAEVVAVAGGYDAALAAAALETGDDTVIISDSSWTDFDEIPGWVTEGYATIFEEAVDEIERRGAPAVGAVVVPLGTGALAAATGTFFRVERFGADVALIGVEPTEAPCFSESVISGRRTAMPTPVPSRLGLARGLPSPLAWEVVSDTFDAVVTVADERVEGAVVRLEAAGVLVSPAGATALAGLIESLEHPVAVESLSLGPDASVLVVATASPRR